MSMKLDFSPQINAGHLLNAVVMLILGTGGIFGFYLSLWASIRDVAVEAAKATAAIDRRVVVLEDHRRVDEAFQSEVRVKLDRALESLARIRSDPNSAIWDKSR